MSTRPAGGRDTVVLIHGLWLNGKSWEGWEARFFRYSTCPES